MDISKFDATKRQLDTAINLYFKDAYPVSIHTLTAAAHQILMDLALARSQGVKSFMKDMALKVVVKGKEKEYLSIVNEAENFFKHAEKDHRSLLDFRPEQTEYLLFDAVEMYMQLASEMPEDMSIFRVWFLLKHHDFISDEIKNKLRSERIDYVGFSKNSKAEFYKNVKLGLMQL